MAVTIHRRTNTEKGARLALRISAKEKFALELLAQKEGLTLSTIVMKALERPLKEGLTISKSNKKNSESIYIPDEAYDPLIPDRLVRLALVAPELLTDSEKVIWKVIQENTIYMNNGLPDFKAIRDKWKSIQAEAKELHNQYAK